MTRVTVDVSAAGAWVLPDEASDAADELYLRCAAKSWRCQAPGLWAWEVGNLLRMAVRRKRLGADQAPQALDKLAPLDVLLEPPPNAERSKAILALALGSGLTFYDASYLEQALRTGASMATKDAALRAAAMTAGVPCLPL